jgi:hypothetical protein
MSAHKKTRVEIAVETRHLPHIQGCLANLEHEDFTVSPILSGWGVKGYWSSEYAFSKIGEKVMIRFTADAEPVAPFIASGFGILASSVLVIRSHPV